MPYGIPGETPAITKKMESCVADRMKDPKFKPQNKDQDKKSAAVAVCKASIMKSMKAQENIQEDLYYKTNYCIQASEDEEKIKVLPKGIFETEDYGDIEIDENTLHKMAENLKNHVREDPYIDIEHGEHPQYKNEAAGWINPNSVEVKADGLYVSRKYNELGQKLVKGKRYRFLSPEFALNAVNKATKKVLGPVLKAVALVNRPLFAGHGLTASEEKFDKEGSNVLFYKQDKVNFKSKKIMNTKKDEKNLKAEENEEVKKDENVENNEEKKEEKPAEDKQEEKKDEQVEDKQEEKKEEVQATEEKVVKAQEELVKAQERISKLENTIKAKEVNEKVDTIMASEDSMEPGKVLPKYREQVRTIYASEDKNVIKAFEEVLKGGVVTADATGAIGGEGISVKGKEGKPDPKKVREIMDTYKCDERTAVLKYYEENPPKEEK